VHRYQEHNTASTPDLNSAYDQQSSADQSIFVRLAVHITAIMGASISKMMGKIFGSKEMRLLMLGLDAAGKTSMTALCLYLDLP
jgi:signal recognition particle GTPase